MFSTVTGRFCDKVATNALPIKSLGPPGEFGITIVNGSEASADTDKKILIKYVSKVFMFLITYNSGTTDRDRTGTPVWTSDFKPKAST